MAAALLTGNQTTGFFIHLIGFSLFFQIGLAVKWLSALWFCHHQYTFWSVISLATAVSWLVFSLFILQIQPQLPKAIQTYPVYLLTGLELLTYLLVLIGLGVNVRMQKWQQEAVTAQDHLAHRILRHHFLFNTLNTTAYLIQVQPDLAEDNLIKLAELYRLLLKQQSMVTLQEEIAMTSSYLELEQSRFNDRLTVQWKLPEQIPTTALMPALLLQPLAENAVYHGIEPSATGGTIVITITVSNNHLHFSLRNPYTIQKLKAGSNYLAQHTINQRLVNAFGTGYALTVQHNSNEYIVHFKIPYKRKPL